MDISINRQYCRPKYKRLCGVVVGDETHEEEVVGLNPGLCTYLKRVKNKSCEPKVGPQAFRLY